MAQMNRFATFLQNHNEICDIMEQDRLSVDEVTVLMLSWSQASDKEREIMEEETYKILDKLRQENYGFGQQAGHC